MRVPDIRRIVGMANEVGKKLTGDFDQVRAICDGADIVWAVWPGGEMMIVKGEAILQFIAQGGVAEELALTAIPCLSAEQAEALKQVLGERL